MSTPSGVAEPPARRAPRLSPDESIADVMTRAGRFARIDPRVPAKWPGRWRVAGVVAWAAFTGGCVWTAWRRSREGGDDRSPPATG